MTTFTLTMHPASDGDALQLTWGSGTDLRHAWLDMGRIKDYANLEARLVAIGELELLVFTHIDADHIEGAVAMFKKSPMPMHVHHVLYNAYTEHVEASRRRGVVPLSIGQAEKLSAGLASAEWPRNAAFASQVVSIDSPEAVGALKYAGGLEVQLLSPSDEKLAALLGKWNDYLKAEALRLNDADEAVRPPGYGRVRMAGINVAALASSSFVADTTMPNGASIAFIAEFQGRRILCAADAHPGLLEQSLRKLGADETARYRIDCMKVSHHGSKANTSSSLLAIIDCTRFAFSTDGTRHQHPDPETIARILTADPKRQKTLIFNFRQKNTTIWDDPMLKKKWNYECVFPAPGQTTVRCEI